MALVLHLLGVCGWRITLPLPLFRVRVCVCVVCGVCGVESSRSVCFFVCVCALCAVARCVRLLCAWSFLCRMVTTTTTSRECVFGRCGGEVWFGVR